MLKFINTNILGPAIPLCLFVTGIFLSFKLHFFHILHFSDVIKSFFQKSREESSSPFKAVTVALAGTLGVGNIVGVASAITIGGAGAIFWMWAAALISMILKYSETVLALEYRETNAKAEFHGGAPYYMASGLGAHKLALLFSALCILTSFPLGNIIQLKAAAEAAQDVFGISFIFTGLLSAIITYIVTIRGIGRISDFTVRLIPILSGIYILMSLFVIGANLQKLPDIVRNICSSAFDFKACVGGGSGFMLTQFFKIPAVRFGAARGLLSNEAGCGTSPFAHASADTKESVKQGFLGIFEVFFDTIVLCSMTAFVVLISFDELSEFNGITLVIKSYEQFIGPAAGTILTVSIFFFAIGSVISWSFYGSESVRFINRQPIYSKIYLSAYSITAFAGIFISSDLVWELADFSLALMTLINLCCIILLSDRILTITENFFKKGITTSKKRRDS